MGTSKRKRQAAVPIHDAAHLETTRARQHDDLRGILIRPKDLRRKVSIAALLAPCEKALSWVRFRKQSDESRAIRKIFAPDSLRGNRRSGPGETPPCERRAGR